MMYSRLVKAIETYGLNRPKSSTWAAKPSAPPNNTRRYMTDVGPGVDMRYDSAKGLWLPASGTIPQATLGAHVAIAPSGTMGNNGAVTLGTALATTFSAGLYLYFPANAISSGSAAGFYWTVMSSTTAGTVYNNVYTPTSGPATKPASNTAFVTTGPGAYTGATTEITVISTTINGGLLGSNGSVCVDALALVNNNVNSKTVRVRLGSTAVLTNTNASTLIVYTPKVAIANQGDPARQISTNGLVGGNTSIGAVVLSNVDTTADQTLTVTLQLATATDFVGLLSSRVEVIPR